MEFLVEFEGGAPAGTSHEEVHRRERAESDAAADFAGGDWRASLAHLGEHEAVRQ